MQDCPASNGAWHREHSDFLFTQARLGLPLVLPINDGTGPLGLILVIVGLDLPDLPGKRLQYVIEVA